MLSITRRVPSLLEPQERREFDDLIAHAFRRSGQPVRRSVPVAPLSWKRFARERGIGRDTTARELTVFDWVALHGLMAASPEGLDVRASRSSGRRRRPTGGMAPGS